MPEGDRPWNERTTRDVYNLKVFEIYGAERRANKMADAGAKTLNVVVVQPRVENAADWERMAARADGKVVDVDEVPTEQTLLGTPGTGTELSEELRSDLPKEEDR